MTTLVTLIFLFEAEYAMLLLLLKYKVHLVRLGEGITESSPDIDISGRILCVHHEKGSRSTDRRT